MKTKYYCLTSLIVLFGLNVSGQACFNCTTSTAINQGLLLCLPFDNDQNDESGNGFTGILMNGPTKITDKNGTSNGAYQFNGTNQFIRYGDILDSVFSRTPNAQFSISLWLRPSSIPTSGFRGVFLSKSAGAAGPYQWYMIFEGDGKVTAALSSSQMGPMNWVEKNSLTPLSLNTWYHVVMTFDGNVSPVNNRIHVYLNTVQGNLRSTNGIMGTTTINTNQELTVGAGHSANQPTIPNNLYNGAIDEIRIYNRVLTTTEIQQLYESAPVTLTPLADVNICRGDSVRLTATGGTSYLWTPGTGVSNPTIANPFFKPTDTTQYVVQISRGLCSARDTVRVQVNQNCCVPAISSLPTSNLVLHLPFNGTANDIRPSPATVTVASGVTAVADRNGISNSAYNFLNPTTHRITVSPTPKLSFNTTTSLSFGAWIFPRAIRTFGSRILSMHANGGFELSLAGTAEGTNAGKLHFLDFDGATLTTRASMYSSINVPLNQWSYVMAVVDRTAGTIRMYINQELVGSMVVTNSAHLNCGLVVGNHNLSSWGLDGIIDDVRIYNVALSTAQVATLVTSEAIQIATTDTVVCKNSSIPVALSGAATQFAWSPTTGVSDPTIRNPIITPLSTPSVSAYVVTATNGFCISRDTIRITTTSNCCADCRDPFPVNNGLIACYPLDSNALDQSGNGHHGTVFSGAIPTSNRNNQANSAYVFNGNANSYIRVPASPQLNTASMSNFTYACWFNPSVFGTLPVLRRLFNIQDVSLVNYDLSYNYVTQKLNYINFNGVSNQINLNSKFTFEPNRWYHVAVVIDAANITRLYVNGQLDTFTNIVPIKPNNPIYTIGSHTTLDWNFAGRLDDIRIYNRALSQNEINEIMPASRPGPLDSFAVSNDASICIGDSVQLGAMYAFRYTWTPANTLSDDSIAQPFAKPTASTYYRVTGRSGVCTATDSVLVSVGTIVANAGRDTVVCVGDSIRLQATGGSVYRWRPDPDVSDTTIANPFVKPSVSKYFHVRISSGNCTEVDSVFVQVLNGISADAGSDVTFCVPDSIQLQASGGIAYQWIPATGLNNPNIPNPKVWATTTATFIVRVSFGSCVSFDTIVITNGRVLPSIAPVPGICAGDSVQLVASGGTNYTWQPDPDLSSTTINNPYAKPDVSKWFYVTVSNGVCSAIDSINVTVNVPEADAGADVSMCAGDTVTLNGNGNGNALWSPTTGLAQPNAYQTIIFPTATTSYILQTLLGTCVLTDTVLVTVHPNPLVAAGSDINYCNGTPVRLNGSSTGADNVQWTPTTGLSDPTSLTPLASPSNSTVYTLLATNTTTGCSASDELTVNFRNPVADFELNIEQSPVPFTLNSTNTSTPLPLVYNWLVTAGTSSTPYTTKDFEQSITIPGSYTIRLVVTDPGGCRDTAELIVIANDELKVFIPNAFTPNRDGKNETFAVNFTQGSASKITGSIWNRWGMKVYDFDYPNQPAEWDGKIDGQVAPDGVYVYIIEVTNSAGGILRFKGTVTLVR